MEHRLQARTPYQMMVKVYDQGSALGWFYTLDLSHDGLCLQTGCLDFQPQSVLELEFFVQGEHHRAQALVIHDSSRGTGLMLATSEPRLCDAAHETIASLWQLAS